MRSNEKTNQQNNNIPVTRKTRESRQISHLRKRFNVYNELVWAQFATAICLAFALAPLKSALLHPESHHLITIGLPMIGVVALGIYTMQATKARMKRDGL